MPQAAPSRRQQQSLLQYGVVARHRRALASSNQIFLADLTDSAGLSCRAIYKPCRGESPLWDFPAATLYKREYLAYRLAAALAWDIVPPTVIRDGPYGVGSMQLCVNAQDDRHYFNIAEQHPDPVMRIALLDCLINNADRKGGHVLLDSQDQVWAIDHGLGFSPERKLRTVMWDIEDRPIPDDLKHNIAAVRDDSSLRDELAAHLAPDEVAAFDRRLALILASATLPFRHLADLRRPYPWPVI